MIDISKLKVGDRVHYQPKHFGLKWENGIVKEIGEYSLSSNCIRVVYNCAGNWKKFKDYTSALTDVDNLFLGWKHE